MSLVAEGTIPMKNHRKSTFFKKKRVFIDVLFVGKVCFIFSQVLKAGQSVSNYLNIILEYK